jgi:tetratricopeptide (TPR) repeat protein
VLKAEEERVQHGQRVEFEAWDQLLRGLSHLRRGGREGVTAAREVFDRLTQRSADLSQAWTHLALCHVIEILNGWAGERRQARARAREAAERACALDASDPDAHHVLGALATECGQLEAAVVCFELAIEIDPSHVHALSGLGQALAGLGRCEEGAAAVERAIRLSPRDPLLPHFLADLAVAHFGAGRFELSARYLEKSRRLATLSPGNHAVLAASYAWLGRPEASV